MEKGRDEDEREEETEGREERRDEEDGGVKAIAADEEARATARQEQHWPGHATVPHIPLQTDSDPGGHSRWMGRQPLPTVTALQIFPAVQLNPITARAALEEICANGS